MCRRTWIEIGSVDWDWEARITIRITIVIGITIGITITITIRITIRITIGSGCPVLEVRKRIVFGSCFDACQAIVGDGLQFLVGDRIKTGFSEHGVDLLGRIHLRGWIEELHVQGK